jgi:hypothetical protein
MSGHRPRRAGVSLAGLALAVAALAPAARGDVTFTGDAEFVNAPSTSGAGTLKIVGLDGKNQPALMNTGTGFKYTNAQIQYTSAANDFNAATGRWNIIQIDWTDRRQFKNTAGNNYTTTTALDGSVVVPPGGVLYHLDASTGWDSIAGNSVSMVNVGTVNNAFADNSNGNANLNMNIPNGTTNTTAPFNADANDKDFLVHSMIIDLKPSAANQVFTINLPTSDDAGTGPVAMPEPSSLTLCCVTALFGLGRAWRSRRPGPGAGGGAAGGRS